MSTSAEREFPGLPASARSARAFVAALVSDSELWNVAVLAADELAANAIQHSRSGVPGGTFTVCVEVADAWARIEVTDQGGGERPVVRGGLSPDAVDGRGLSIVCALAAEWGVVPRRDSLQVWARFDR